MHKGALSESSCDEAKLLQRILLEKRLLNKAARPETSIPRTTGPKPLSFAQEGVWFYNQLAPLCPLYVIPRAFRIRGRLNLSSIRKAFEFVVARHEALRTRIIIVDGKPRQTSHEAPEFRMVLVDISSLEESSRQRKLTELIHQEARSDFRLTENSLIRAQLIKCHETEHVLLVSLHHIVSDYRSLEILYEEAGVAYDSFCSTGTPPKLPPLPFDFSDVAVFERTDAAASKSGHHLDYWKTQLGDSLLAGEFPTDYPRPAGQSFNGAHLPFRVPSELTDDLRRLGKDSKVTLHLLLLAAFKCLLLRYSNYADIAVGVPMSAREVPGSDALIGFFINTLPLRPNLTNDITFLQFLEGVDKAAAQLYSHSQIPFAKLVQEFSPASDLSRHPLFQIVFQFFSDLPAKPRFGDTDVEEIFTHSGTAKFDLTMSLANDPAGLSGDIEFATDLFAKPTIERMVAHFNSLLRGIVANPSQKLSELPLLTKQEEQTVLVLYNQTQTAYPREATIHQLFEEQSVRTPNAPAVRFADVASTYAEINQQANRLAHHLLSVGVRQGDRVGLCVERSVEMIVSLLAILKVGGCYVPLDPHFPGERLTFMSEDAGLRHIVTFKRWQDRLHVKSKLVFLDEVPQTIPELPFASVETFTKAEDAAYIIYTSGSTGEPKGVVVSHRGVVRLVKETNYVKFSASDVFVQFAPLSFDASTFEIWGALLNGASLVIFPPSFDSIEQLGSILEKHSVTTLWLSAGLFHEIVDHHLEILQPVRTLLAGGEALSSRHVAKVVQRYPACELINGYGPTENTTFTCCYRIPNQWNGERPVPIGRPISNTCVYVLDQFHKPMPIGLPGELCVGGDGLAFGYLNRPALTSEKFIPSPFASCPGKLYRTGDLVRYLPDGNIEFLGRRDNQIKIRGFRVELEEIEHALLRFSIVQSAVVLADRDSAGRVSLIAYLIPKPFSETNEAQIRDQLGQKLPTYMIPSRVVFLEHFPTTANGKVDRKHLAGLKPGGTKSEATESPQNAIEARLTTIWQEALDLKAVGRRENFFNLGGHSLLATRIVSRVNHEFQRNLALSVLFEAPTIAELAKRIEMASLGVPPPIKPRQRAKP
jgi:amino acid adenylation domain-containing protein